MTASFGVASVSASSELGWAEPIAKRIRHFTSQTRRTKQGQTGKDKIKNSV